MMIDELDSFIASYQLVQKHKYAKFLQDIKHEFANRTSQQRRDRLDEINQESPQPSLAAQSKKPRRVSGRRKV